MKKTIALTFIVFIFAFCEMKPDKKPISPQAKVEFRLAFDNPTEGFEEKEIKSQKIYLSPKIEISEKDIAFIYKTKNKGGNQDLFFELKPLATKKFETLTANNIQKKLAILVNGNLIMCPIIQTKIPGGKIEISQNFSEPELDSLFKSLTEPL